MSWKKRQVLNKFPKNSYFIREDKATFEYSRDGSGAD